MESHTVLDKCNINYGPISSIIEILNMLDDYFKIACFKEISSVINDILLFHALSN